MTKRNMMKNFFLLVVLLLTLQTTQAQKQEYKISAIGFYNFENLFDLEDHPDKRDEDFTPTGSYNYTEEIYQEKLSNLSKVVAEMGKDMTPDGVAVLGVAEIENRKVLEDFVQHPNLKDRHYQIVHYESPDFRGIDVALLYNPKYFLPTHSEAIPLKIYNDDGSDRVTRDILYVAGYFDGEPIHIMVNHWPSRRGGAEASAKYRNAGAAVCKGILDSLTAIDPNTKVVIMGDLNDDPTSPSVKKVLNAQRKAKKVKKGGLYNPYYDFYMKGIGTTAWRDAWSLFDQIIISSGFLKKKQEGYRFYQSRIHNPSYMTQKTGQFKGYPWRTYSFGQYIGGYSDHFPVYVYIVKPL
jgi:hypothetical protein